MKKSGSISTKTGFAPTNKAQFADAMKLKGDVITSSPGPISLANNATCSALVPDVVAIPYSAPQNSANFSDIFILAFLVIIYRKSNF